MIGVVGGVGCQAGVDLVRKIYALDNARRDQDALPLTLVSAPHRIVDRSDYLLGKITTNPGEAIADIVTSLASHGAEVIAIPCNTAHAKPIVELVKKRLPENCQLVHLIEEVAEYLVNRYPAIKQVGVLATTGTVMSGIYTEVLAQQGIGAIVPDEVTQTERIHQAIYHPGYGIKAQSQPVTGRAKQDLLNAATSMIERGAEAIVLACTEIPLAIQTENHLGCPMIDANQVLAKALIRASIDG